MKVRLTSETRSRHTRNLMVRHQEPFLPAHEHNPPLSSLSTTHRQVGSAEVAFDGTERRPESLPMSEIALAGGAPTLFGREEPKARADDFAIEVGRQFGIVRRQVMDRQGTRQGRRGEIYILH